MRKVSAPYLSSLMLGSNSKWKNYFLELLAFGYKQAISCIFPAFIFLILGVSKLVENSILPRYDFMLLACILAQLVLLFTKVESKREIATICMFHLIGLVMELHKVNVGSWSYPEEAYSKIWGVPLYSGFMYSSVASYICRAWDNFDLRITHWPLKRYAILAGCLIYLNFFTNAYVFDYRWILVGILVILFWKTKVYFNSSGIERSMPMLLAFVLIGFFIWIAENIATYLGAWKYSYQHDGWQVVELHKISSWSLLVIVSVILIANLKFLSPQIVKTLKNKRF